MKKYLLIPIPLLLGCGLCLLFSWKTARYDPETASPHVTEGSLFYLAHTWLLIGIGLGVMLLGILVVYDVASFVEKRLERRATERARGANQRKS